MKKHLQKGIAILLSFCLISGAAPVYAAESDTAVFTSEFSDSVDSEVIPGTVPISEENDEMTDTFISDTEIVENDVSNPEDNTNIPENGEIEQDDATIPEETSQDPQDPEENIDEIPQKEELFEDGQEEVLFADSQSEESEKADDAIVKLAVRKGPQVSLGYHHSAAIKEDGSLWLWGENTEGQIGDGTTKYRPTPVKIMDGVAQVSLGWLHSAAIKEDGSLWLWGHNIYLQIGDGTLGVQYRLTPVHIMDLWSGGVRPSSTPTPSPTPKPTATPKPTSTPKPTPTPTEIKAPYKSGFIPNGGSIELKLKPGFDFINRGSDILNYDLALNGLVLSQMVHEEDKVKSIMNDLGYENIEYKPNTYGDLNHPVVCFGSKKLTDSAGNIKNVYAVVVRGTNGVADLETDWLDNFDYFEASTGYVRDAFVEYAESITGKSLDQLKNEDNYLYITGHSLGGAVANRLFNTTEIADLVQNQKNHIYTYTYEAPHTVEILPIDPDANEKKHKSNAFNFKDVDDAIPNSPPYMGATRYGTDFEFSVHDLDNSIFKALFPNAKGGSVLEAPKNENYGNIFGHHDTGLPLVYIIQQGIKNGFWKDVYDVLAKRDKSKEFSLKKDNNSFIPTNSYSVTRAGFKGVQNYQLDDSYYNRLTSHTGKSEKNRIQKEMQAEWSGASYGLAMTMAMLYDGRIKLKNLTDSFPSNYYQLKYPCDDPKFLNAINSYQLSQFCDDRSKEELSITQAYKRYAFQGLTNLFTSNEDISKFLEKLVNFTSMNNIGLLDYSIPDTNSEHTVIVLDCDYDEESQRYIIKLYDADSVKDEILGTGKFSYMYISNDYSSFDFVDANGNSISNYYFDRMYYMVYLDKVSDLLQSSETQSENHVTINFERGKRFRVTAPNGRYIEYDGTSFSGDMNVYEIRSVGFDNKSYYIMEIEDADSLTLSNIQSGVDFDVSNANEFLSIAGENISDATLTLGEGIDLNGSNYSFEAYLSTDGLSENENGLVSVSANAQSDVSITTEDDKVVVDAEEPMTDITSANYEGPHKEEKTLGDSTDVTVSSTEFDKDFTPTPTPTATETPTPEVTPTDTPTPTVTEEPAPETTPSTTPVPETPPTDTPTPEETVTPIPEETITPSPESTPVPEVSTTPLPTPTPEVSATPSPTPAPSLTPGASETPGPVAPESVKATTSLGKRSITFSWESVEGVAGYQIYRKVDETGKLKRVKTILDPSVTSYSKLFKFGKTYTFQIRSFALAADGKTRIYGEFGPEITVTVPEYSKWIKPQVKAITKTGKESIYLSWGEIKGADGYKVYQYNKTTKKYDLVKTLSGSSNTAYVQDSLRPATQYGFRVRSYAVREDGKDVNGKVSTAVKAVTPPGKVTKLSASSTAGQVKISWKKVDRAKGYQVYRSTTRNGKYALVGTVSQGKTVRYTDSSVESEKEYYYKVRAYTVNPDGSKSLGKISTAKKVKVK